ncbi:MAG TPA: superoxide dismutase [Coriobacteriia bacterium]|jgi:Fe-Mn family superoxide dismutase
MEHRLPELQWARDALAPVISEETIEYHYGKHHATYVANLNKLIAGMPLQDAPLDEIVKTAEKGSGIYNNACQHWNHTMYWQSLTPNAPGAPSGELKTAIERDFGSFDAFKEQFAQKATTLFGSGWTWLVETGGTLEIVNTPNGDTPMRGGGNVLLVCDVWEHAYYIDYRNARPKYVDGFWQLANWDFAAQRMSRPSAVAMAGI